MQGPLELLWCHPCSSRDTQTLWCLSRSSQLRVTCKPAEGALCPLSQLLHEAVDQDWHQHGPSGCSAHYWPPTWLCCTDPHPVGSAFSRFSALPCLPTKPTFQQLLLMATRGTVTKAFLNILCSPHPSGCSFHPRICGGHKTACPEQGVASYEAAPGAEPFLLCTAWGTALTSSKCLGCCWSCATPSVWVVPLLRPLVSTSSAPRQTLQGWQLLGTSAPSPENRSGCSRRC